ncbi:Uncharacterised protein [Vibrio cholerae]|nr:Uncharacterised protein [Vibrio cholerae]
MVNLYRVIHGEGFDVDIREGALADAVFRFAALVCWVVNVAAIITQTAFSSQHKQHSMAKFRRVASGRKGEFGKHKSTTRSDIC